MGTLPNEALPREAEGATPDRAPSRGTTADTQDLRAPGGSDTAAMGSGERSSVGASDVLPTIRRPLPVSHARQAGGPRSDAPAPGWSADHLLELYDVDELRRLTDAVAQVAEELDAMEASVASVEASPAADAPFADAAEDA